eukprot:g6663.t1
MARNHHVKQVLREYPPLAGRRFAHKAGSGTGDGLSRAAAGSEVKRSKAGSLSHCGLSFHGRRCPSAWCTGFAWLIRPLGVQRRTSAPGRPSLCHALRVRT